MAEVDVGDAGGEAQRGGDSTEVRGQSEGVAPEGLAQPQLRVAELLDSGGEGGHVRSAEILWSRPASPFHCHGCSLRRLRAVRYRQFSIAVVVRFVGAVDVQAEVVGLLGGESGEAGAESVEMQPGHLLVEAAGAGW